MRVTNSMMVSNYLNNLNTNLASMSDLLSQQASGKKYAHISDDPVSVIYSQQARYKLARLEHYKANVDTGLDWLKQVESSTTELSDMLASAYEQCINAATDVKNGSDKKNAAEYIGQIRDQILDALNSTFGDKFVYGGYNTTGYAGSDKTVPPFTVVNGNLCYNGVDLTSTDPADLALIDELRGDVLTFDTGIGSKMPVTINGIDMVFYGTDPNTGANLNIFNLVDDLYNTVSSAADAEEINAYITDLQNAQSHVLSMTAELGGKVNRLEILQSRYEQDEINYTQMKSDAEDVDFSEVVMKFKMAQAVYNAALSSGSYIIQYTLMDFLN